MICRIIGYFFVFGSIVQVIHLLRLFVGRIMERNGRHRKSINIFRRILFTAGIKSIHANFRFTIVSLGIVVQFFGDFQATICEGLIIRCIAHAQQGKTRRNLSRHARANTMQNRSWRLRVNRFNTVRTSPIIMISFITDVYDHILDFTLGILIRTQVKFCTVASFAQHVRNTIRLYDFVVVECIMVIIAFWVRCRKHRKHQERITHGWRHLQEVTSIVPTARNRVMYMARSVEPGLRIATALHAKELEVRIAHHGIDLVTHDECRRIFLVHLDAEALVCRERGKLSKFTCTHLGFRNGPFHRVTPNQ